MTSRFTRLMAVARIARRDAVRHKGRTVLIVGMLMLPALAFSFALTTIASGKPTPATLVNQQLGTAAQARISYVPGCDVLQGWSGQASQCRGQQDAPVSSAIASASADEPDPAAARRLLPPGSELLETREWSAAIWRGDRALTNGPVVEEIEFGRLPGLGYLASGRWPTRPGEVVLDPDSAASLKAAPGDTIDLVTEDKTRVAVTLTGIGSVDYSYGAVAWPGTMPAATRASASAHAEFVTGTQPVGWSHVQQLNKLGYFVTSRAVVLHPPANVPEEVAGPDAGTDWTGLTIGAGFIAVALIEVILIIGPAFAVGARRSRRTLALMSTSGGEAKDLRRFVSANGIGLGALGGGLGAIAGVVAAALIVRAAMGNPNSGLPNLVIPYLKVIAVIPATAAIGLLAAYLPGRAVAKIDVVTALRDGPDTRQRQRAFPLPGVILAGLALALIVAGIALTSPALMMAGVVVLLLALAALSGALVSLAARLAPRAGVATRIALRDAERHRSRTAPALAAVLACVAGGTVALCWVNVTQIATAATYGPMAAEGRVMATNTSGGLTSTTRISWEKARALIEKDVPLASVTPVGAVDPGPGKTAVIDLLCPGTKTSVFENYCGNPAAQGQGSWSDGGWYTASQSIATLVDDGTAVTALGLPGWQAAAQALREGKILVNEKAAIGPDGMATIQASTYEDDLDGESDPPQGPVVKVPAVATGWKPYSYAVVLSQQAAAKLGLKTTQVGFVGTPAATPAADDATKLTGAFASDHPAIEVRVERAPAENALSVLLLLALVVLFVAAAATWIAVGLAAADSRADLASLTAVGAAPRTRRRFAGAQAGVITVTGAVIGTIAGLAVAYVAVAVQAEESGAGWSWSLPWLPQLALTAGVPLTAMAGAYLFTRSKPLRLTRRAS